MVQKNYYSASKIFVAIAAACLLALLMFNYRASAINAIPTPEPKPGSFGVEATKKQAPPTQAPTISTPGNGASYSESPITVNGVCINDLLVQVYNNGVMAGAVMCKNNTYSVQVSLFAGTNELTAIQYDDLEQASPVSNTVTINYTDTSFKAFGSLLTLTSSYGRRSSPAGNQLDWPLQLSGGSGPYAFSIDWGDGQKPELKSQSLAGIVGIDHVYKKAGIYQVNVSATDTNGVKAFLQVIAVSSGKVETANTGNTTGQTAGQVNKVLWLPAAVALVLLIPTYWLGRRSEIISLRNKMLKEHEQYEKDQNKPAAQ